MKIKKNLTLILLIILIISLQPYVISATETFNFETQITQAKVRPGNTVTIDLRISNINKDKDGINAIQGDLSYDKEIFENPQIVTLQNNWTVSLNKDEQSILNGRFVLSNINSTKEDKTIAQLKLDVKNNITNTEGNIYFKNIISSYGLEEITSKDKTVKVSIDIDNNNTNDTDKNETVSKSDNTTLSKVNKLPQTGFNNIILIISAVLGLIICIYQYIEYRKM